MPIAEKRAAFRKLHESGFFLIPNAWDIGSAVRLERLDFRAIASTSAGAAWAIGKEDGELTLDEALAHLRLLVGATALPVNADFENGFADDPRQTGINAALAAETGVAGLSIEDWSGSAHYHRAFAAERIAASRAAIDRVDPAVMLIGRHEYFRNPALPASEAIARAVAYAEAGADAIFVPGLTDHGAIAELVAAVAPRPVNVVVHAYDDSIRELAALGVRRCSVGGSLARTSWDAFDQAAATLKQLEP
jgi:2-methylisocitrate lyase-like PEP mutase family enzyme